MKRLPLPLIMLSLFGCAGHRTYSDLTARTSIPNGVSSNMQSTSGNLLMTWGAFGTSSIWVAYPIKLPDTVIIAWRDQPKPQEFEDHKRTILLAGMLPRIDPAKQKYHLQFWFHLGDSLAVKADVVDIGDCSHTKRIGATRTPHHGPCGVMNDW